MNTTLTDYTHQSSMNELDMFSQKQEILDMVDSLDDLQLRTFSAFYPKDLKHYVASQEKWLRDSTYFLGIDLGRRPSPGEIADKILNSHDSQRFRAYYALCHPELVSIDQEALSKYETSIKRIYIDL